MARNIAAAGMPLRVWNRSRDKAEALRECGALVAESPAQAAEGADIVVTMLFDMASVAEVMTMAAAGLSPGVLWLQTSTVGVVGAEALAGVAQGAGLSYVDAPVLGTKQPAESGELIVLASGEPALRERIQPVLEAIGKTTLWLGPAGAGSRLKLAVNAWVLTVVEGVAESLALTEALGLDPHHFLDAVRGGPLDAPYVQLKGAAMLAGDFSPAFGLAGAAKDAGLVVAAAQEAGVDSSLLEVVESHLRRAVDAGHGDLDMSATYLEHGRR